MADAKGTVRTVIRNQQSKENTAVIQHKKQAARANDTSKKHALNDAYFHCIKTSYFTHQNQSNFSILFQILKPNN